MNRKTVFAISACIFLIACLSSVIIWLVPHIHTLATTPIYAPPAIGEYRVGNLNCNYQIHVVHGEFASIVDGWGKFVIPSDIDYPDTSKRLTGEPFPGIVGLQHDSDWWYGICEIRLSDMSNHMFYFIIDPHKCKIIRFDNLIDASEYLQTEAGCTWNILLEPYRFARSE